MTANFTFDVDFVHNYFALQHFPLQTLREMPHPVVIDPFVFTAIETAVRLHQKVLDLQKRNLTTLPPQIQDCKTVTTLNLNDNILPGIPFKVCLMRGLQKLLLEKNRLTVLTPDIGNLSVLRVLSMPDNLLEHLPAEIGRLSNLQELEMSYNWLVDLPPGTLKLTAAR